MQLSPSLQSRAPILNSVTDPWVMVALVRLRHRLLMNAFPVFLKAEALARRRVAPAHAVAKLDAYDGTTVTFTVVAVNTAGSMSLRVCECVRVCVCVCVRGRRRGTHRERFKQLTRKGVDVGSELQHGREQMLILDGPVVVHARGVESNAQLDGRLEELTRRRLLTIDH